jgi:hypothetical protein
VAKPVPCTADLETRLEKLIPTWEKRLESLTPADTPANDGFKPQLFGHGGDFMASLPPYEPGARSAFEPLGPSQTPAAAPARYADEPGAIKLEFKLEPSDPEPVALFGDPPPATGRFSLGDLPGQLGDPAPGRLSYEGALRLSSDSGGSEACGLEAKLGDAAGRLSFESVSSGRLSYDSAASGGEPWPAAGENKENLPQLIDGTFR